MSEKKHQEKKTTFYLLSVSVLMHVALLVVLGGAVIIERSIRSAVPVGDLMLEEGVPIEQALDVMDEELAEPTDSQPDMPGDSGPSAAAVEHFPESMSNIISSEAPATFQVAPGLSASVLSISGVSGGPKGAGTGGGGGGGTGAGGGKPAIRKLFGTEVEANRLGVIVDVSGTATPYLLPTLKEIEKNFSDSVIVLVCGCALSVPKGKALPFSGFDLSVPDPGGGGRGYTAVGYIQGSMQKDPQLKKLMFDLQKDPNAYLMDGNGLDVTNAFVKLFDEKVDAIYWFSDFRDTVKPEVSKTITSELKKRGMKLYLHTFTGKPVPALQNSMVEETGGKTIVKVP